MLASENIFITGGAGYLGKNLVRRFYEKNNITIYSRDEAKHYFLKKQFPNLTCIIGDIRDRAHLMKASRNHSIGIFAASLKQIEAVDQNVDEAVQTIVHGALNSRACAVEHYMDAATFISSDKSRAATTLYGSMKFVAGEAFIVDAEQDQTKLSSVIYGNVLNSTGSIIPLIWDAISNGYSLPLFSTEMTRFGINISMAMDTVEVALNHTGINVIPALQSFKIQDLFQIYSERFGLSCYNTQPRISEKIHEVLITEEECPRVFAIDHKYYGMHYKNISASQPLTGTLSSNKCLLNKAQLEVILSKEKFYQP